MRASKYDKYICIIALVVFFYSFFFVPVKVSERKWSPDYLPDKRTLPQYKQYRYEYPTSIFIVPLICFIFFGFMVFKKELEPFTIRKSFRNMVSRFRNHIKEQKHSKLK